MNYIQERIGQELQEIARRIVVRTEKVTGVKCIPADYKDPGHTPPAENDPAWIDQTPGCLKDMPAGGSKTNYGEYHAWFKATVTVPDDMKGKCVDLKVASPRYANPQHIVYLDGHIIQGSDENHETFPIDSNKDSYELVVYSFSNNPRNLFLDAELRLIDEDTKNLYYNIRVPFDVMCYLPFEGNEYCEIRTALNNTINLIDLRTRGTEEYHNSVKAALDYINKEFYGKTCGKQMANVVCVGHSHIDTAWLWPFRQTIEKCQRTFSTVVNMMKEFPEYHFFSSQPQQLKFVKEHDPELYEEIKKFIKEGRWQVDGAMWVEADCNLPSGESFVRQLILGKTYLREEFGVESNILWLPDVFGYSAALPQILQKAGVNRFVTSKISWNETNTMPCDVFKWKGIDGTEILSYFLTAQDYDPREKHNGTTYNGDINPRQIRGTWERFQQKELHNEVINTFGFGDGGGGPTREMIEAGRRLEKGIPGCPTVTFDSVGNFLDRLEKDVDNNRFTPNWVGELYLEYHRGTYTSIAKNKRNNRKSEFLYENTELASVMDNILCGKEYPKAAINEGWETICLNQFHDVIPGSSIKEVYDDTDITYANIRNTATDILEGVKNDIKANIATDGGVLVFNPNSFENSDLVKVGDKYVYAKNIPAKGYKVVPAVYETAGNVKLNENARIIENKFVKVKFDKNYNITSIYDKKAKREVLPKGEKANRLTAYEDIPRAWDAWEITNYYTEKYWNIDDVTSVTPINDGAKVGYEIVRPFQNSTIIQRVTIDAYSTRIDFDTTVDWKNDHILLKTAFPTNINADKATYDIQYGTVERPTHYNTSWEQAKFEVCAHKFADLSEYGYGVSIINDCKYGHDIHNGVIRLSLLKSATSPNPAADKEVHNFTYSIFPHAGNYRTAGTIKQAYNINNPMSAELVDANNGNLPESYSTVSVTGDNVYIDAVKQAEKSDDIVVRLYDAWGCTSSPTVTFGFDVAKVESTNLLEEDGKELAVKNNSVTVPVKPFEIITLKVTKA